MKEKIKELFDEYQNSDMNFFELEKRILDLFDVSNNEVEVCDHEFIPKKCWVHKCLKCGELHIEYKEAN